MKPSSIRSKVLMGIGLTLLVISGIIIALTMVFVSTGNFIVNGTIVFWIFLLAIGVVLYAIGKAGHQEVKIAMSKPEMAPQPQYATPPQYAAPPQYPPTIRCTGCGYQIAPGSVRCPACAAPVPGVKICPTCGVQTEAWHKACAKCGFVWQN